MKKKFWLAAILLTSLLLVFWARPVAADDGQQVSDDDVNKIASQLYCPICENVPLDVCPSQACANWRELIRKMLEEGKSEEEIKAYFAAQYGWSTLAMPPRTGLNWLIYVLPPLITIGGIVLVGMTLRKSKKMKPEKNSLESAAPSPAPDEYMALINQDLNDEEKNG